MPENNKSEMIEEYCKIAVTQEECTLGQPSYRNAHCRWNARSVERTISERVWKQYYGLRLTENYQKMIQNSSVTKCEDACYHSDWCKSFDFNHKFDDPDYKKCWMYDKSMNEENIQFDTSSKAMASSWHFEK